MQGYNFTEAVRAILAAAREEAQRLRHEFVGTEHILLGILKTDEGLATEILSRLSIDMAAVKAKIEEIIQIGNTDTSGADLPYTSRAKKVLELSMMEARELGDNYVGSEHLLLGLLREEKGIAAQVLTHYGLKLDAVRAEVLYLLAQPGKGERVEGPVTFTTNLRPFLPHLDALVAAPAHHKLLLENEYVRILETRIMPGDTTLIHEHRFSAAHYVISWSQFVRRDESGNVLLDTRQTDFNQHSPQALWGAPLGPHTVENVGSAPLHIISVELKSVPR